MEDRVAYRTTNEPDNLLILIGRMQRKIKVKLSREEMQSFTMLSLMWLQTTQSVRGNFYERAQYMTYLDVYEKKLRSSAVAVKPELKISLSMMQAYVTLLVALIISENLASYANYERNIINQIIQQIDEQSK